MLADQPNRCLREIELQMCDAPALVVLVVRGRNAAEVEYAAARVTSPGDGGQEGGDALRDLARLGRHRALGVHGDVPVPKDYDRRDRAPLLLTEEERASRSV